MFTGCKNVCVTHPCHCYLLVVCSLNCLYCYIHITLLPSQLLWGHFTKFNSKTIAQFNADVADGLNGQHQVSRMTDGKGETWSPSEMSQVRNRPESGGRLFHAHAAATGKARSPRIPRRVEDTCSVVVSAERRQQQATISDFGCRLSDRYSSGVPCTQWYAKTLSVNRLLGDVPDTVR